MLPIGYLFTEPGSKEVCGVYSRETKSDVARATFKGVILNSLGGLALGVLPNYSLSGGDPWLFLCSPDFSHAFHRCFLERPHPCSPDNSEWLMGCISCVQPRTPQFLPAMGSRAGKSLHRSLFEQNVICGNYLGKHLGWYETSFLFWSRSLFHCWRCRCSGLLGSLLFPTSLILRMQMKVFPAPYPSSGWGLGEDLPKCHQDIGRDSGGTLVVAKVPWLCTSNP